MCNGLQWRFPPIWENGHFLLFRNEIIGCSLVYGRIRGLSTRFFFSSRGITIYNLLIFPTTTQTQEFSLVIRNKKLKFTLFGYELRHIVEAVTTKTQQKHIVEFFYFHANILSYNVTSGYIWNILEKCGRLLHCLSESLTTSSVFGVTFSNIIKMDFFSFFLWLFSISLYEIFKNKTQAEISKILVKIL